MLTNSHQSIVVNCHYLTWQFFGFPFYEPYAYVLIALVPLLLIRVVNKRAVAIVALEIILIAIFFLLTIL